MFKHAHTTVWVVKVMPQRVHSRDVCYKSTRKDIFPAVNPVRNVLEEKNLVCRSFMDRAEDITPQHPSSQDVRDLGGGGGRL